MQVHLIITGFVQGVGFRQFIKQHAQQLDLTGWVCNRSDGSVEALVQGDKKQVEAMIELCQKGPFLADVTHVFGNREKQEEQFSSFTIRHDSS